MLLLVISRVVGCTWYRHCSHMNTTSAHFVVLGTSICEGPVHLSCMSIPYGLSLTRGWVASLSGLEAPVTHRILYACPSYGHSTLPPLVYTPPRLIETIVHSSCCRWGGRLSIPALGANYIPMGGGGGMIGYSS